MILYIINFNTKLMRKIHNMQHYGHNKMKIIFKGHLYDKFIHIRYWGLFKDVLFKSNKVV